MEKPNRKPRVPHAGEKNAGIELFVMSIVSGVALGVVFNIVLHYSLPPTDGAYGTLPFSHPIEGVAVFFAGSVGGMLGFPFALRFLERASLGASWPRVLVTGVAAVVILTPFSGFASVPIAFVAMVFAMAWCSRRYRLERASAARRTRSTPAP